MPLSRLYSIVALYVLTLFFSLAANAQSRIDSLQHALKTKPNQQLALLIELCWEYRYHHPDSARLYGYQALKIAKQQNKKLYEAEALHNLAVTYEAQGDYRKSLNLNLEALKIRKQLHDDLKTANTLNNIGIAYDELGNFSLSLKYYREAYDIYKKKKHIEGIALVSVNLGILFKAQQDYKNVIKYYREANAIYTQLNKPREIAFTETNLGSVYFYTKQYDSCIYYSLKAQQKLKELNILQFLPTTYTNAGIGYAALGQNSKALQFLETAVALNKKYNNRKELAFSNIHLAKLMLKINKLNDAQKAANEALSIAESIRASKEVMDSKLVLAEILGRKGEFKSAYQLNLAANKIKDSLFQLDKTKLIADYQVRYQTEKKEEQIKLLHQRNTIQQLKLKQRNLLLGGLVALLIGLAIVAYLIVNRRRLKAKAELQTEIIKQQDLASKAVLDAEERERRRIASDLHDGIGQMLSAALMNLNGLFSGLKLPNDTELKAQQVLALVNESYDEMRSISHQMMPNALIKSGLASAVKEFIGKLDKEQLQVTLSTVGLNERLDEQTETVIYRVIQETVNNVIKHAEASKLDIQIIKDEEGIAVTIEDDGKGFDKDKLDLKSGLGLSNIYSRVGFLKGTVDVDSSEGNGTLIAIHLPMAIG